MSCGFVICKCSSLRVQRIEWLPGAFILLLKDTKCSSKVLDVMTKVLLVV